MDPESECQESVSITFEWTVRGLQNLFDSSKGESKSKVTKSARFGGGRWQILFYANAGATKEGSMDSGGYVSLYLSCEPTTEEKEAAMGDYGRWHREGVYKFSFELRNIGKSVLYNVKEANNHLFSHKTANWGWAQFAKRDTVYYQSNAVKAQDTFIIICNITSSPAPPVSLPVFPRQTVPKGLLDTVGALLDDPLYSDVEFIIPRRGGQRLNSARRIWASRRLLKRAEYFETMFNSGFAEGSSEGPFTPRTRIESEPGILESESNLAMNEFEDSDDEEDDDAMDDSPIEVESVPQQSGALDYLATSPAENIIDDDETEEDHRNVRAKLSHPSSPRSSQLLSLSPQTSQSTPGSKMTVVVKDVAYSTYLALLYYIYTDTIVFAPLSSSFILARGESLASLMSTQPPTSAESQGHVMASRRNTIQEAPTTSRREWIKQWMRNNPGRPAPCSAKAAYKLADRLDLRELKERAAQHIFKSLSVENIAYEVFSPFAATFDEIRQVQVNFFLTNWQDIRASDSMRNVWQQIRSGRHPGFEEVWPVIAQSLEFKPTRSVAGSSAAAGEDTTR